jgi:hypothetical protein
MKSVGSAYGSRTRVSALIGLMPFHHGLFFVTSLLLDFGLWPSPLLWLRKKEC